VNDNTNYVFFGITFLLPILIEIYRLISAEKSNWSEFFTSSSLSLLFVSVGFVYGLVEKNSSYQVLYLIILMQVVSTMILEKMNNKIKWPLNTILIISAVAIPFYFLFQKQEQSSLKHSRELGPEETAFLNNVNSKGQELRKMCSRFLNGEGSIDEQIFKERILECSNSDEKNLYFACLALQRGDNANLDIFLKKINVKEYETDKAYISSLIDSNGSASATNIVALTRGAPWLGISQEKLNLTGSKLARICTDKLRVLILDASARTRNNLRNAIELKSRLSSTCKTIDIGDFDYHEIGPGVHLYSKGYQMKAHVCGVEGITSALIENGVNEFREPSKYLSKKLEVYDVVVVTH
jgi:hypothetical protein